MPKGILLGATLALVSSALPALAVISGGATTRGFMVADGSLATIQYAIDFAAASGRSIQEVDDSSNSTISGAAPDDDKISDQGSGKWEIDDSSNSTLGYIEDQGDGKWEIDDSSNSTLGYIEAQDGKWEIDDSSNSTIGYIEFQQ